MSSTEFEKNNYPKASSKTIIVFFLQMYILHKFLFFRIPLQWGPSHLYRRHVFDDSILQVINLISSNALI